MDITSMTVFPDSSNVPIVIQFCQLRNGKVEVKFSREGNHTSSQFTELIGFNEPIKALRKIFNTINMVRGFYPDVEFFYNASGKRARVYKRFW